MKPRHTSHDFEAELRELRSSLVAMGARCERAVQLSIAAFLKRDTSAADEVVALDERINRDELEIDDLALRILALRQPVAYDLRFIATTLKFVTDLERVGDKATNIAKRVKDIADAPQMPPMEEITPMSQLALSVLREALDAFVVGDAGKADGVLAQTSDVDALAKSVSSAVTIWIEQNPASLRTGLAVLAVVRQLKRVADHAANLAEQVVFLERGDDVRHRQRSGKP
jgi:phosphate transport system protein